MKRKVSAGEARKRLGELLEWVFYRGDEVVIERAGKPMAVVIPVERYKALQREEERLWGFIERAQKATADVPYEEIEHDIERAIAEVRGRPYPATD